MTSLSETSILLGSSGVSTGFTIDQSVRFDAGSSSELQISNAPDLDAGAGGKLTYSFWLKRVALGSVQTILKSDQNSDNYIWISIQSSDQLSFDSQVGGSSIFYLRTTSLLRDPSAWYHIVLNVDTSQAVSSERVKIFINGSRVLDLDQTTYPSLNQDIGPIYEHNNNPLYIGEQDDTGNFSSYYLAEFHSMDNYAYGPEYFGEFTDENIWIPKEVSGVSYGTGGWYLDFSNAAELGTDASGAGNTFAEIGGLDTHDQMLDSPTNNFCVMNAIENVPCNFSEGNLTIDSTANFSGAAIRGTVHIRGGSTGKWYYEVVGSLTGDYFSTGWLLSSIITPSGTVIGQESGSVGFYNTGSYQNTTNAQGVITKPAAGDVIGVGLDASTGQVFLRDDSGYFVGTLSGNALSSGVVITGFSGKDLVMASRNSSSGTATYNFGQDGTFAGAKTAQGNTDANGIGNFFYTVPDGFLAICTKNLGS